MSEASAQPIDPRIEAALRQYLERLDRGEAIDRDAFVAGYPEIADKLRDLILTEEKLRKLAGDKACRESAGISTRSFAAEGQETVPPKSRSNGPADTAGSGLAEKFGRYQIIRELGKGAMGAVYLAFDTQLKRQVAIKTPQFEDDPTGELLKRFYREAEAAGVLLHANICPVYDVGEIDGKHFISMAYINGRPLSSLIDPDKPQGERQVLIAVHKLAKALQEAHEHGIVHRDLKPANILIDKRGEPIIMDFGLARKAQREGDASLTHTGMIIGSPAYMSPEQVEGEPEKVGPASDQYSLGVVLYEMLTGQLPFRGSVMNVLTQIITTEPTPLRTLRPALDPRIEVACRKMMAKDEAERFESAKAVADELANILKHPPRKDRSALSTPSASQIGTQPGASHLLKSVAQRDLTQKDLESLENLARKCLVRRDYDQMIQILERVPEARRTDTLEDLLAKARAKTDEIAFLICEIDEADRLRDARTALKKADELLKLKPAHHRALEVQEKYSGTGDGEWGPARIGPAWQLTERWHKGGWIPWAALAFGLAIFGTVLGVVVIYINSTAIVIDVEDPEVVVSVEGKHITITGPKEEKVYVEPGKQQLKITYAGLETIAPSFEIKRGQKKTVTVSILDKKIVAMLDNEILRGFDSEAAKERQENVAQGSDAKPLTGHLGDHRSVWHVSGTRDSRFRMVGKGMWREEGRDRSRGYNFVEVTRTAEFVELIDKTRAIGGVHIRLREGDAQIIWGGRDNDWKPFASGHWEKNAGSPGTAETGGSNVQLEALPLIPTAGKSSPMAPQPPKVAKPDVPQSLVAPFGEAAAKQARDEWAAHLRSQGEATNSVGMKLELIPPGRFEMGSRDSMQQLRSLFPIEMGSNMDYLKVAGEWPVHPVTITKPFYLAKYMVTKRDFKRFVDETRYQTDAERNGAAGNGARRQRGKYVVDFTPGYTWRNWGHKQPDDAPVVNVSYNDAIAFCKWLSDKERKEYRLPTEAEWEYACRAGTVSRYYNGDDPEGVTKIGNIRDAAWTKEFFEQLNFQPALHSSDGYAGLSPVGKFQPNNFGLYDMLGNAFAYCADWYSEGYYANSPANDPTGPPTGTMRVKRGGSWWAGPIQCRASRRLPWPGDRGYANSGFRVALTIDAAARGGPGSTDPERRAAEAMLALGGTISVRSEGAEREIPPGSSLPSGSFELTRVQLNDRPEMSDAQLEPLQGASHLLAVWLRFDRNIGDVGLAHLKNHTTLQQLNLSGTQVTDAGMATVESLVNLELLAVERTRVTAAGLSHIEKLSELHTLWIGNGVRLTDAGLAHLQNLTKLRHITLWGAHLDGPGFKYLESLKQLESLALSGTHINDEGLSHLQGLQRLRVLHLAGTRVTDAGLAHLRGLTSLNLLNLSKTRVTNTGLADLRTLTALRHLDMRETPVTQAGADELRKVLPECEIMVETAAQAPRGN